MTCLRLSLIILSTGYFFQKFEAKLPAQVSTKCGIWLCTVLNFEQAGLQIYGIVNGCPGQYYPIKIANTSVKVENNLYFLKFDVVAEEEMNEDFNVSGALENDYLI